MDKILKGFKFQKEKPQKQSEEVTEIETDEVNFNTETKDQDQICLAFIANWCPLSRPFKFKLVHLFDKSNSQITWKAVKKEDKPAKIEPPNQQSNTVHSHVSNAISNATNHSENKDDTHKLPTPEAALDQLEDETQDDFELEENDKPKGEKKEDERWQKELKPLKKMQVIIISCDRDESGWKNTLKSTGFVAMEQSLEKGQQVISQACKDKASKDKGKEVFFPGQPTMSVYDKKWNLLYFQADETIEDSDPLETWGKNEEAEFKFENKDDDN